ncbi:MAG TPA: DUF2752 domain-containing protein [Thermoanaerobaculia bacterium]|nr:DUF2752 domain-containing protein [Thermoanaerobaculia bacterium]
MTSGKVAGWAAAGAGGALGAVLLAHWNLETGLPPLCLLRRVFDLPCPGCGMTRALASLVRGEWSAAMALHPWSPVVAGQLGLAWLASGIALARPLPGWPAVLAPLFGANLAALAAIWVGRLASGTLPF